MNTIQLKQFVAIAELGSMHKAAEKLFVTHQCLSSAVRSLEKEFGTSLMIRGSSGVRLTDHGEVVYEMAKGMLGLVEDAQERITSSALKKEVALRILFSVNTACTLFVEAAQHFSYENRSISLFLGNVTPTVAVSSLAEGRTDAVFAALPREAIERLPRDIKVLNSYVEHQYVVVRRDHPLAGNKTVTLSQLASHPMVLYSKSAGDFEGRELRRIWNQENIPEIVLGTDDAAMHEAAIVKGMGFGIISGVLAQSAPYKERASSLDLVIVPIRKDFELQLYTLYRADAPDEKLEVLRKLDSLIASELGLVRTLTAR